MLGWLRKNLDMRPRRVKGPVQPWYVPRTGWMSFAPEVELNPGDFQRATMTPSEGLLSFATLYRCNTLVSGDLSKMDVVLKAPAGAGVFEPVYRHPVINLLETPNHYQTTSKFFESWVLSKFTSKQGSAFVLKERDGPRIVALHVLDPNRVSVKVSPATGLVAYELETDSLAGIDRKTLVPASEIIHDVLNPLHGHPLVGVPPLRVCCLAASQAIEIQKTSFAFFRNRAQPSGVLSSPDEITQESIKQAQAQFAAKFSGEGRGRVAIVGQGLKYTPIAVTAEDAQLIEQFKIAAHQIAAAYGIPASKVVPGAEPKYNTAAEQNKQYFSEALQKPMKDMELLLRRHLGLPKGWKIEFETEDLIRMDGKARMEMLGVGVKNMILAPNDARRQVGLPPVPGGDQPLAQQQYHSLEQIAARAVEPITGAGGALDPALVAQMIEDALEERSVHG